MSNRFNSFVQSIVCIIAFFIILYAIKLATKHDPDLTGVELVVMSITAGACFAFSMYHMGIVVLSKPTTERSVHDAY